VLAGHVGRVHFGLTAEMPVLSPTELGDWATTELCVSPELWHQKAYLARVVVAGEAGELRDAGTVPLSAWLDGSGDGFALTLEADGSGSIYPVIYVRRAGRLEERPVDPDPLLDYTGEATRKQVGEILREFGGGAG
jgi:hypothetical protein